MTQASRLKFSPFIREAWVIGDKRDYVAAVMCIDYAVVGKWADDKKINYTSYQELSQKPEVYDLVQKQIEEANKDLPTPAKINRFVNLYKVFDADDEELTRTSKLRRAFVEQATVVPKQSLIAHPVCFSAARQAVSPPSALIP